MLEEQTKQAVGEILNQGLLGALLILSWILFAFTIRWFIARIKDAEDKTEKERTEHKKTIETQMSDIRNLADVARAVDNQRPLLEMLIRQRDGK